MARATAANEARFASTPPVADRWSSLVTRRKQARDACNAQSLAANTQRAK
jgi:hypothetical protein